MTALVEQDILIGQEERIGCAAIFAGMFGVGMGWTLSWGVGILGFVVWMQYPHEEYDPSLALSVLGITIASMACALVFAAMVCLVHFSIIPKSVAEEVRLRWRWCTFGGSLAYWYASWILIYIMSATNMLGLETLLEEAYGNAIAKATIYAGIFALGGWAGVASMSLMVLPQWWATGEYQANVRWWSVGMMVANGLLVGLVYLALAEIGRYG